MALLTDIEKALEQVAAAVPEATKPLRHDSEQGVATQCSSRDIGSDAISGAMANEKRRIITKAADFPTLDTDSVVAFGEETFLVTSLKKDPVSASMTIGISDALTDTEATLRGYRNTRKLTLSLNILCTLSGFSPDIPDGFSGTAVRAFDILISIDDWPETSLPQTGDTLRFYYRNEWCEVAIVSVDRRDGYFVIKARSVK